MRPAENIKKLIQSASIKTNPKVNKAVLNSLFDELDKSREANSAILQPNIWRIIMRSRITKLATAAVIIAAITIIATVWNKTVPAVIPTASASAVQVLTDAAKAVEDVRSIHIKARMRTLPADNFGMIGLEYDFVPIEMWKKVDDAGIVRWRVEKPGRVIATNENSTIMFMKPNEAVKEEPCPIGSFDTWYAPLMNVDELIDNALKTTMNRANDQLCMHNEVVKNGTELVIEIESTAQGDYTNDYLKNKYISDSDNKKVYHFDAETKLLKGFEVYVHTDKEDVLVFEVTDIEYNPQIDNSLFTLELPQDVIWYEKPKVLPDNEKYQQMTPKQAAEAFFKACADRNWDEVLKFWSASRVDERLKEYLGGLEIISIGEPFKSGLYPGWFVPYEIKLPQTASEFHMRLSNANSAKRFVITGMCDSKLQPVREMKWTNEPNVPANNDTYVKMSPEDVVKAFNTAFSKEDWDEMRKFMPDFEVDGLRHDIEIWKKQSEFKEGQPFCEVAGEAFWSAEHSAYFVKCRQFFGEGQVKKMNLAVRNDNPAKRWVVDGGI
jgi:outer membrane lipoprotein-sorting protein